MNQLLEQEAETVGMMPMVRYQVIRRILVSKTFTISELVRWTRCKPGSVRTVVQRLRQDGFVEAGKRQESSPAPSGFGAPALNYHLVDDEKKRRSLRRALAEINLPEEPLDAEVLTSSYFVDGRRLLDDAVHPACPGDQRLKLIEEAEAELAIAQSMAEEASALVRATVDFEKARLLLARAEPKEAYLRFHDLAAQFSSMPAPEMEVQCYEYLLMALEAMGDERSAALELLREQFPAFRLTAKTAFFVEREEAHASALEMS